MHYPVYEYIIKTAILHCFPILEGCNPLNSSLEAVRMTTEGFFILDVSSPPEAAVSWTLNDLINALGQNVDLD